MTGLNNAISEIRGLPADDGGGDLVLAVTPLGRFLPELAAARFRSRAAAAFRGRP